MAMQRTYEPDPAAEPINSWLSFGLFSAAPIGANLFAVAFNFLITRIIFDPVTVLHPEFLERLSLNDQRVLFISGSAFPIITIISILYFLPLIRLGYRQAAIQKNGGEVEPGLLTKARRRAINAPLLIPSLALLPWGLGATVAYAQPVEKALGTQLALNSLMAGAVAVITSLFLAELVLRTYIAPRLFRAGNLRGVPGGIVLRLSTRMLLLAAAICILPLSYYHLLLLAGNFQLSQGVAGDFIIRNLHAYSRFIAPVFGVLGLGLTVVLARSFAAPLRAMEKATERIEKGDHGSPVRVVSNDEIGVLGDSMNSMMAGLRDRARILDQFGRLVDPRIRDYLLDDGQRLAGRRKEVVVFFCDIRSFTALSERIPPEEVFTLLNGYFTVLADVIERFGGHVDKYIGDAVMAVFGLFDDRPMAHHCRQAHDACLAIRQELARFNAERAAAGSEAIRIGMGLHVGEVLAGKLGSEERFEYTVIGDTVNVASRIESLTKKFDTDLILTDSVLRNAGATANATYRVKVRGREEPITIHAL